MCTETRETTNYLRLVSLIIDIGTNILYKIFIYYALLENSDEKAFLSKYSTQNLLAQMKKTKVLTVTEFNHVTTPNPRVEQFDISLLITLLCNLFSGAVEAPEKGWDTKPAPTDLTLGADLLRLRRFRNKIVGHLPRARLSDQLFCTYWNEIESIFVRLCHKVVPESESSIQQDIKTYKCRHLDQEEEIQKIKDKCEDVVKLQEKVETLLSETNELKKYFQNLPKRYSCYIRLLFEGGQAVLLAVLKSECSKRKRDIHLLLDGELKVDLLQYGIEFDKLQTTSPEKWDILYLAFVIQLLCKDTMTTEQKGCLDTLLDARKNYAKIAIESLDEVSISNRREDLVLSLTTLSHGLGNDIEKKCAECIRTYRVGQDGDDDYAADTYLERLRLHGVHIQSLSAIYKDTLLELKKAMKKMMDEGIVFKTEQVFQLKMITLGKDSEKRKLAEDTLETVWQAALDGSGNSNDFEAVRQEVDNILKEIRKREIRPCAVNRKCIVLSLKCPSPGSVIELLDYIDSTPYKEHCFLLSNEISDIYGELLVVSASLTFESILAALQNQKADHHKVHTSEGFSIDVACDSVEGVYQVYDLLRAKSTIASLSIIAEELSKQVDEKIDVKLEFDDLQFPQPEITSKSTANSDDKRTADRKRKLREGLVRYGYTSALFGIIAALLIVIAFPQTKLDVEKTLVIVNSRVTELESIVKHLSAVQEHRIKTLDYKPVMVESQILNIVQELKDTDAYVFQRLNELASLIHQLEETIEKHIQTSEERHNEMAKNIEDLRKFGSLEQKVNQDMKDSVDKLFDQIEKLKKTRHETDNPNESKADMERVKTVSITWTIPVVVLSLLFMGALLVNMRRQKILSGVLDLTPRNPKLENKVCMICFNFDKSVEYSNLLSKVCDTPFKQFLVNRHEDLIKIPRCRLYVMFVEFSERHVIIEEPGLGLGSLRRCTHDAVAKLGGTLIIIYTRDPGSRNLSENTRYNTNIYCVSHQPELISLKDDGRFFSIYDRFTQTQIDGLRDCIKQYVR